jgi:hypothetical protein
LTVDVGQQYLMVARPRRENVEIVEEKE